MGTERIKINEPVKFNRPRKIKMVNFTVAAPLLPRRSLREEEVAVLAEERDSFRRAADALLEERKKWQEQVQRAREQVRNAHTALSELKCSNALLRRAVEETVNPELRLNAVLASPAIDSIFEQLEKTGQFALTQASTSEERELLLELIGMGKVALDGTAFLTESGRQLLRDWT